MARRRRTFRGDVLHQNRPDRRADLRQPGLPPGRQGAPPIIVGEAPPRRKRRARGHGPRGQGGPGARLHGLHQGLSPGYVEGALAAANGAAAPRPVRQLAAATTTRRPPYKNASSATPRACSRTWPSTRSASRASLGRARRCVVDGRPEGRQGLAGSCHTRTLGTSALRRPSTAYPGQPFFRRERAKVRISADRVLGPAAAAPTGHGHAERRGTIPAGDGRRRARQDPRVLAVAAEAEAHPNWFSPLTYARPATTHGSSWAPMPRRAGVAAFAKAGRGGDHRRSPRGARSSPAAGSPERQPLTRA